MNPSLALIPSAYKAGKLYSVLPDDGTGDLICSRNGSATYFDKDGILRIAAPNEPRLDFDPLTGEFKGVLVEPAATNIVSNNNTSNTVEREALNTFLGFTDNEIGPNIRTYNFLTSQNGVNVGTNFSKIYTTFDNRNTEALTIQFFLKKPIGETWRYFRFGSSINQGVYDWELNSFNSVFGTNNIFNSKFINNEYRLLSIYTTSPGIGQFNQFRLGIVDGSSSTSSLIGNWGISLYNNRFDSLGIQSPIITSGSQVTRPADLITRTNARDLIGQSEGSFYVEFEPKTFKSSMFSLSSAGITNHISLFLRLNGFTTLEVRRNSQFFNSSQSSTEYILNIKNKFLITYSENGYNVFLNGIKVNSNINFPVFSGELNRFIFSLGNNSSVYTDYFKNISLFKTALTDEQAIALTTL